MLSSRIPHSDRATDGEPSPYGSAASAVVPLRCGGTRKPLFLIHGVDGTLAPFERLVSHLGLDRPIYGIQSQILCRHERALIRLEDQSAFYLQEVRKILPQGPYHLLGFSFGGLVAFEMAQQIQACGGPCGLLGLLDNLRMASAPSPVSSPAPERPRQPGSSPLVDHLRQLARPGGLGFAMDKLRARSLRTAYILLNAIRQPIPAFIQRPYDINWFAAVRYVPRPYCGRVTLFQSVESTHDARSNKNAWTELAGEGVHTYLIPGDHENLFAEPNVRVVAQQIAASLADLA